MYDTAVGGLGVLKRPSYGRLKLTLVSRFFGTKCRCPNILHTTNFRLIILGLSQQGLKWVEPMLIQLQSDQTKIGG